MTKAEKPRSKHSHFWRACRYLWPYRLYGVTSIFCAFFVGLTLTGGLGALLPLLSVLINGDTVQKWAYRGAAENRMAVRFSQQDPGGVQIVDVTKGGPAAAAGLKAGDVIEDVSLPENGPASPFPVGDANPAFKAGEILRRIARGGTGPVHLVVGGRAMDVTLKTPVTYPAMAMGLGLVEMLPIRPVPAVAAVFGLMALLTIAGQGVRFFQEYLSDKAGILAVNDMRRQLYDRVLRVPMQFF